MKKKVYRRTITILAFLLVVGLLLLSTGGKITGIMLSDYSISVDGNVMTLKVGVASSIGYIRTMKTSADGNSKKITFYSTFGINSNIGAQNEFQIVIQPSCDAIYFYSGNGEYRLMLLKNSETNVWERAK